jgi:excisionase family DNA binding protein
MQTNEKRLLTESEAAEILSLTPRQVGRLARRGEIPRVEMGKEIRYDPRDIWAFVEARKKAGAK